MGKVIALILPTHLHVLANFRMSILNMQLCSVAPRMGCPSQNNNQGCCLRSTSHILGYFSLSHSRKPCYLLPHVLHASQAHARESSNKYINSSRALCKVRRLIFFRLVQHKSRLKFKDM